MENKATAWQRYVDLLFNKHEGVNASPTFSSFLIFNLNHRNLANDRNINENIVEYKVIWKVEKWK